VAKETTVSYCLVTCWYYGTWA